MAHADRTGYQPGQQQYIPPQGDIKQENLYHPPPPNATGYEGPPFVDPRRAAYQPAQFAGDVKTYQPASFEPPSASSEYRSNPGFGPPPPPYTPIAAQQYFPAPPNRASIGSISPNSPHPTYYPPPPPPRSPNLAATRLPPPPRSPNLGATNLPPPPPLPHPLQQHALEPAAVELPAPGPTSLAAFKVQPFQPIPLRPHLPPSIFSEPYIGPEHTTSEQSGIGQSVPQFEPPPTVPKPGTYLSVRPGLPPRAPSAPSGTLETGEAQFASQPAYTPPVWPQPDFYKRAPTPEPNVSSYAATTLPPPPPTTYAQPASVDATVSQPVDDPKSSATKRFVGNMLVTRLARSAIATTTSTAKLPFYLSPWGDNNPAVLPNLRKRDVALAVTFHLGVGALGPGALSLVDQVATHAATWTAEQVVHEGSSAAHSKMRKDKNKLHKIMSVRPGVVTLEIRVKHKLIGENAQLVLHGEYPTLDAADCSKGWFCPYLYASAREPQLARFKDFGIAVFIGPGLTADTSLAPTILAHLPVTRLVNFTTSEILPTKATLQTPSAPPPIPGATIGPAARLTRLLVLPLGISPYRTATAWSQSRIPNEARLKLHVFPHLPALILPLRNPALLTPAEMQARREEDMVLAWSPWTAAQMSAAPAAAAGGVGGGAGVPLPGASAGGFELDRFAREVRAFLAAVVDGGALDRARGGAWLDDVGEALAEIVRGVQGQADEGGVPLRDLLGGVCEMERVGVVMLRF